MEYFFDLQKIPLYTPTYEKNNYVMVYGYKVPIPDTPEDKYCINAGLKPQNQIINYFPDEKKIMSKRVLIPDDLEYWEIDAKELFIEHEWHRRKNGIWILLNGKKYYITGVYYFFLNYWILQTGRAPVFRMSDLDFFLIWMYVVRNPKIYGLVDFKCRRIGDTEKALCIIYEYASRVKNTINGMQDCRKEDEIIATYARLTFAHERMMWFMKPINRGTTNPKSGLEFKHPETHNTMKKLIGKKTLEEDVEFEFPAIGSEVKYYVSEPEAADAKRHGRMYVDEFGKFKKLNPQEAWRFIKKTLVDEIMEEIIGKALFTSTVEEMKGGTTLDIAQEMWDEADPELIDENGETTSGMIRIVRGALERGRPDKFGQTDKEALQQVITNTRKDLIQKKKFKKLIEYNRQNCVDIEDVFAAVNDESGFNIENLSQRKFRLQYEIKPPRWVRGNFEWLDGKMENRIVVWNPCSTGRWVCAGKPEDWGFKSNAMNEYSVMPRPANTAGFCGGVDPYAQKDVLEKTPSKGGIVIKRKLDGTIDGDDMYDEKGDPLNGGEYFKTNRYVCAYLYRHPDPADFYNDVIKTMVFWGSDFIAEKNHSPALLTYLELKGYAHYTMEATLSTKNYKGQIEKGGISANEKSIENYFSYLTTLSHKWWNTIDIPDILDQLLSMNYENRGKKDLGVAAGFCEMAAQVSVKPMRDRSGEDVEPAFAEHYV